MDWLADGIAFAALAVSVTVYVREGNGRKEAADHVRRQTEASEAQVKVLQEQLDDLRTERASNRSPEVQFVTEPRGRMASGSVSFTLRNVGVAAATGLEIDRESLGGVRADFDPVTTLGPGEGLDIRVLGALGRSVSSTMVVRCNELPNPVSVRVP